MARPGRRPENRRHHPDPRSYRRVSLDSTAEVRHRDELVDIEAELAATPGVTVLLYDDRCAAEERRLRKRERLPAVAERVWINQRVCEGCGDCGQKSSCLSVVPVETAFGRKTEIHQSSCNQDFSCLDGNCPSFVVVTPTANKGSQKSAKQTPGSSLSLPVVPHEPVLRFTDDELLIRIPGIGGTGVVTISQILQMAAHIDGRHVAGLEQIGLAQKGGPVVSDIHISTRPVEGAILASEETVDVVVACDALSTAAPANLSRMAVGHTVAVVNTTHVPTAAMVRDPAIDYPTDAVIAAIEDVTAKESNLYIPAQWIAEQLFGDHLPANMVLIGAAYQHGCLPVRGVAIEDAIRLNGVMVDVNLLAFRWGRAAAIDLDAVVSELEPTKPVEQITPEAVRLVESSDLPATLSGVVTRLVNELISYQDIRYAEAYLKDVVTVAAIETAATNDGDVPVSRAYATSLFKLLAYKDEYEVARLHLDTVESARFRVEFGENVRARVMLHPPLLKTFGLRRKISLGRATGPAFVALRAGRRLRGRRLDPFGHSEMRRLERALPLEYKVIMSAGLAKLRTENVADVKALAETPDLVRGYEEVKLAGVERFRQRAHELLAGLG